MGRWWKTGLLLGALVGGCGDDDGTPSDGGTFDGALDGGAADDAGSDAGRDAGYVFDASFSRPDVDVTHPMDDTLRLNHLQCEGTHNSYHRAPPGEFPDWQYDHAPLDVQLESQGVRKFELDVWWNNRERLWHVYHVERIDDGTTCERLLECLATIRTWSDAHPGHHPIFVQIETKTPFDDETGMRFEALDEEIRTVFPEELIVSPAMVQGDAATLREAVTTTGWPTLGEVRGRVLFFLNCSRQECELYASRDLRERPAFPDSRLDDPWAAVRILNSADDPAIPTSVAMGMLVRTRAISMPSAFELDADGLRAELDAALASGAHFISTDVPVPREDVALHVEMPEGMPSRCNPVSAPEGCTAAAIEDPSRLRGN
ncbi:MAG: Ca2+-dependent phosphoinositide-specific phospholipase C [Polyangiales bacterium]